MGYTTDFTGEIKVNRDLIGKEIAFIKELFEFDPREGDYGKESTYGFYHIDLEFNNDFSAIQYNGMEKSYEMVKQVQYVIDQTIAKFPDLVFSGKFMAQGEEFEDRWMLTVEDNVAREDKIVIKGQRVTCPHCEREFILEEKQ